MHHHRSCCCGDVIAPPCCGGQAGAPLIYPAYYGPPGAPTGRLTHRLSYEVSASGVGHPKSLDVTGGQNDIPVSWSVNRSDVQEWQDNCTGDRGMSFTERFTEIIPPPGPQTGAEATVTIRGSASSRYDLRNIVDDRPLFHLTARMPYFLQETIPGEEPIAEPPLLAQLRLEREVDVGPQPGATSVSVSGSAQTPTRDRFWDMQVTTEVLRTGDGFPRGLRVAATYEVSDTIDRPEDVTDYSAGSIIATLELIGLTRCPDGALMQVPRGYAPSRASDTGNGTSNDTGMGSGIVNPQLDPGVAASLEQQARGGGCAGCGP